MPKTKFIEDESYERVPSNKYTMISSHVNFSLISDEEQAMHARDGKKAES